jgi:hypothetical protein
VDAPYLPFMDGPSPSTNEFRWRLGVRPLDLADWIQWGPDTDAALREKTRLNTEFPESVFVALDDVEAESTEVADALVQHLAQTVPHRHRTLDQSLHPLDAAARLVPEDLVLMVERGQGDDRHLVFGAGSVCFPNRWDLRSKLGQTMAEVHAPVAMLNDHLEVPVDRFFDRLRPERSFWRLGWGLLDTPAWYTPLRGAAAPRPETCRPDQLFLRVERETLRRFPETHCVLFTIRTSVTPLPAVSDDPAVWERLAASVEWMPPAVRAYKDVAEIADGVIEHLRQKSQSQGKSQR